MNINILLRFKAEIFSLLPTKSEFNIAVAVSGGSDSIALAILLNKVFLETNVKIFCITIDHGLRKNSLEEAEEVGRILMNFDISHQIISWIGKKPLSNIQEAARLNRYRLLTEYCHKNNISYLATGHQQNDQAENFLIRADHGSGLYGLAGIPKISEFNIIKIIRPLLEFNKNELQEFLQQEKITWIEDPSNKNGRFTRVRFRNYLEQHPQWVVKLSNISKNLNRAKECVEYMLNKSIKDLVDFSLKDQVSINYNDFNQLPQEIRFRMLAKLLQIIGNEEKIARGERIEKLINKIELGKDFKASTLGKCLIKRKKDKIIIEPEMAAKA